MILDAVHDILDHQTCRDDEERFRLESAVQHIAEAREYLIRATEPSQADLLADDWTVV